MRVTNLRLIWNASSMPRINITIGWNCVNGVVNREAVSLSQRNRGQSCEAIYVTAKAPSTSTKFEFIFTTTNSASHSKLFGTILSVNRAYETTKLYRELKMRGSFIREDFSLKMLPQEYLCERVNGAWNLSTETGNLGNFIVTNLRIVWYAELNALYNVSVPYLTVYSSRVRESKFGLALVIETTSSSGEYVLGFRIDPPEKLHKICKMIQSLHKAMLLKPIFGVTWVKEKKVDNKSKDDEVIETVDNTEDDVEYDSKGVRPDPYAAYFDGHRAHTEERKLPVLSPELGLAIEPIRDGFTLDDLWAIHVD